MTQMRSAGPRPPRAGARSRARPPAPGRGRSRSARNAGRQVDAETLRGRSRRRRDGRRETRPAPRRRPRASGGSPGRIAGTDEAAVGGDRVEHPPVGDAGVLELVGEHLAEALATASATSSRAPSRRRARAPDRPRRGCRRRARIRSWRAYNSANSASRSARSRSAAVVAARSRAVAQSRSAAGSNRLGLEQVDPPQQARQQARGVAADLMPAQGQLVNAVEQDREPVGETDGGEERVEAGLERVLAQQRLGGLLVGVDPELLVRAVEGRLGAVAKLRSARPASGSGRAPARGAPPRSASASSRCASASVRPDPASPRTSSGAPS